MKIYISTGLVKDRTVSNIASDFLKNNIRYIEFSAGKFEKNILKKI